MHNNPFWTTRTYLFRVLDNIGTLWYLNITRPQTTKTGASMWDFWNYKEQILFETDEINFLFQEIKERTYISSLWKQHFLHKIILRYHFSVSSRNLLALCWAILHFIRISNQCNAHYAFIKTRCQHKCNLDLVVFNVMVTRKEKLIWMHGQLTLVWNRTRPANIE